MHISKEDLNGFDRIKRLNIINSISGIKPANLIGTVSPKGITNLAIFSSVVHLGSNPALIGMITRPEGKNGRHTYDNLISTGFYTINNVTESMIQRAHYTSAKFEHELSEFDQCNFEPEYLNKFQSPYVKESTLKIGLTFRETVPIKANNTELIIGEVLDLHIHDAALTEEGYINLERLNTAGISGLNSYYGLSKLSDFPYARVSELPRFE